MRCLLTAVFPVCSKADAHRARCRAQGLRLASAWCSSDYLLWPVRAVPTRHLGVQALQPKQKVALRVGPGRGSTFSLYQPVGAHGAPPTVPAVPDGQQAPGAEGVLRRRILVADDHRNVAGSLALRWHINGCEAPRASMANRHWLDTGGCYRKRCQLDIGLPGGSGYGVAGAIPAIPANRAFRVFPALSGLARLRQG